MDFAGSSQLNETNEITKGDFMGDSERSTVGAVRVPLGKMLGRAACVAAGLVIGLSFAADSGHAADKKDMGKHPDFSGLWFPAGFGKRTPNPLPFTPKAKKEHDDYVAKFTADDDPGRYCISPGMPRAIWGAPFSVEIFTAAQGHDDLLGRLQHVPEDLHGGLHRPEPVIDTQMGYAVGHWEGDTLVVHTDHLKEYPYMNKFPTSSSAVIDERLHVEEREMNGEKHKFLVDDLTLTDPKVYTEPVHVTSQLMYRPDIQVLEYSCSDELWEAYLR